MAKYTLARIFGVIEVGVRDGVVTVSGIPAKTVVELIGKWLRNRRWDQFFFVTLKTNYFAFYEFYALEIKSMIELLIQDGKTTFRQRRTLKKILEGLEENTWLKHRDREDVKPILDMSLLNRLSWVPKPHQKEALEAFCDVVPRYGLKGYYIAAQPGTGKTFYDICLATTIIPQSLAEVKIVISPKNAIRNVWHRTVKDCFKKAPTDWVSDTKGPAPDGREYYIFHYEALDRAIELCQRLMRKKKQYFVIIDEAHNFNSLSSKRTKALIDICQHAKGPYSIWASGSPIKALGSEVIPILKCIDPTFNDHVEPSFKKIFGGVNKRANEIVNRRFGLISYKIPSTVVGEIPKPTPYRIFVKVPDPGRYYIAVVQKEIKEFIKERAEYYKSNIKEYKAKFDECLEYHELGLKTSDERERFYEYRKGVKTAIKNMANIRSFMPLLGDLNRYEAQYLEPSLTPALKKQFKEVKTIIKALSLKVSGEAIGTIYTKRKAECSADLAKNAPLEEIVNKGLAKTLVFSNWTSPLETLEKSLQKSGFKTLHVYGKDTKNVGPIVDQFHKDEDTNPLLATYQALSTAVPVTAANQVIMIDYPYREYIYSQSIARAARIGQKHPVFVYELALDTGNIPNVSTRGIDIIEFSRTQCSEILGEEFGGFVDDDYIEDRTSGRQLAASLPNLPMEPEADPRKAHKTPLAVLARVFGIKV